MQHFLTALTEKPSTQLRFQRALVDEGNLSLGEIRKLQDELRGHIDDALNSGMSLNDYFKKGKHKNH